MDVTFLEENRRKKFAVLPYAEYLRLMELAADERDYRRALKVLRNRRDKVVDYDLEKVLENPIALKRKSLGISQKELAKKMRVDPSYISRLEKPGANPSKTTLLRVAQALDCSVEDLI